MNGRSQPPVSLMDTDTRTSVSFVSFCEKKLGCVTRNLTAENAKGEPWPLSAFLAVKTKTDVEPNRLCALRRSRRTPQQRDLTDRSDIKDMNPVSRVDDCRGLLLREED